MQVGIGALETDYLDLVSRVPRLKRPPIPLGMFDPPTVETVKTMPLDGLIKVRGLG
jgi:hypothetical protein